MASKTAALESVLTPGFDPVTEAVVESDPGAAQQPGSAPGRATTTEATPEAIDVQVDASAPSIVVVRTTYDEGWVATIDGEPADVLVTNGFLLGVAVDAGAHDVQLAYRDPSIGRGLVAGAIAWIALLIAALAAVVMERRRSRSALPQDSPDPRSSDGDR